MAQFDDEAPPPGYRYVYFGDPAQGTSGRYPVAIETAPAETSDRPIAPHREAPGEVPGTGPTLDQMRLELSQQPAPSLPSLSEYLTNMPREVRDQFMAVGETGMGVFGSMVSPVAAAATGVGKNIYDYLVNGQVAPRATDETANRAAQMFSYQPVMPSAQSILQLAGEAPAALMGTSMGVPPVASGINYRALQAPRGTTGTLVAGVKRDISNFDNDVFNAQRGVTPGYPTLGSEFSGAFVTPRPTVYDMLAGTEPSRIPSTASAAVKPEGNLNFTPNIKADILKGPDIQPVSSLLNQLANAQGLTASGLELGLERLRLLDPAMKMSKSAFVDQLKPSQYEKVDLLGKSDGDLEYYAEQAEYNMDSSEVLRSIGVPRNLVSDAMDFLFQDTDKPSPGLVPFLRQNGWLDVSTFYDIFDEMRRELAYEEAHRFELDEADSARDYSDIQRLVNPRLTEDTYFEIGVKDPSYAGEYRHYDGAPEGTIGHIRGSFLNAYGEDAPRGLDTIPVREAGFYNYGPDHPRAMLIEEIQSDANKGVKQTGPLHQIHGVLFKAAIQHALENGATTVYMPTSQPIAKVRGRPASAYASVYDQQIVKEGINPLKKIPGVTVTEGFDADGETKLMHRIDFTPEAVEYILKGEGQKLPGYAEGGRASKDEDLFALKSEPKAEYDASFAQLSGLIADIGRNRAEYERIAQGGAFDSRQFTPENIYAMRLLQAARATPDPERYLETLSPYHRAQLQFELDPYSRELGAVYLDEPNKAVIKRLDQVSNTIPHELTHTQQLRKAHGIDFEDDTGALIRAQGLTPEMRKSVLPSANVNNMKEVWANINARAHEVNAAGGDFINSPEGRAMFPTPALQREYYTRALPGVNSLTPDTGSFVPNNEPYAAKALRVLGLAEGGAVTDTLDKMVKSPQASTLLNLDLPNLIAAKQQLRPMKQGGTVDFLNTIDDMRYALTRRQG